MKKLVIGIVVLALLAGGAYVAITRRNVTALEGASDAAPVLPAVKAGDQVVADAKVVPVRSVALSLPTGGIVAEVLVTEGDHVEAGQVLLRLDAAQQASAVAQAEADLRAAEARLAKAQARPDEKAEAAAEAAVEVTRAGVQTAEGAVASERANLARIRAGPTKEEIAIAQRQVEQAKNALWGAQNQRDSICGRAGAQSPDCDAARATVQQVEEEVRIADLRLQQLLHGPHSQEIAAVQAQLQQALGQLAAAQSQVRQAVANLSQVKEGPSVEDITIARAQVDQARAVLEQAKVALAETELRAPFVGTVASLSVKAWEWVAPGTPIVRLADLSAWRIETEDLTEFSVVRIHAGDPVTVTFDAIPDLELSGKVVRIQAIGENKQRGDITYIVIIKLDRQDRQLRWNMSALVTIEPKQCC